MLVELPCLYNGRFVITADDLTPGTLSRRRFMSVKKADLFARSLYFDCGKKTRIVRRWLLRNPGSTFRKRRKLLIKRPAPISSTSEIATSATIRPPRMRLPRPATESRPPSLSVSFGLKLDD